MNSNTNTDEFIFKRRVKCQYCQESIRQKILEKRSTCVENKSLSRSTHDKYDGTDKIGNQINKQTFYDSYFLFVLVFSFYIIHILEVMPLMGST